MLGERAVFKMYIKDGCPYCDRARDVILKEMQMSLHTINITKDPHMREMIIEDTGHKTLRPNPVPRIRGTGTYGAP